MRLKRQSRRRARPRSLCALPRVSACLRTYEHTCASRGSAGVTSATGLNRALIADNRALIAVRALIAEAAQA